MADRETPRTRRGIDAVEAALEERELRERIDEPDAGVEHPGNYRLDDVERLRDDARVAAGTDVYTPDEVLDDVAGDVGREEPLELDDDYRPE